MREARGIRAIAVAEHLGITLSAYSKWERGETRLTLRRLEGVSSLLGVSTRSLFHGEDTQDAGATTSAVRSPPARRRGKADMDPRLLQIENQLTDLVILAEEYPLLKHLLSMAALEAQEMANK